MNSLRGESAVQHDLGLVLSKHKITFFEVVVQAPESKIKFKVDTKANLQPLILEI